MRLRQAEAHGRLEEAALGRVPENLVEEPEVGTKRVIGNVAQDRECRVADEIERCEPSDDRDFDASRKPVEMGEQRSEPTYNGGLTLAPIGRGVHQR